MRLANTTRFSAKKGWSTPGDMYLNYANITLRARYMDEPKAESLTYKGTKPNYVKPYTKWREEGNGTLQDLENTYLYKVISDEYNKSMRELYHGRIGCAGAFMREYKLSSAEFDKRMIQTITGLTAFMGYASLMSYAVGGDNFLARLSSLFYNYAYSHCSKRITTGASTNMHWWYQSWWFNFITSFGFAGFLSVDDNPSSAATVTSYMELIAIIFAIMFEHPEETLFLAFVCKYYMDFFELPMNSSFSIAQLDFLALMQPISEDDKSFKDNEEWISYIKDNCTFAKLSSFLSMKTLLKQLQKRYATLISQRADIHKFFNIAIPLCPVCCAVTSYADSLDIPKDILWHAVTIMDSLVEHGYGDVSYKEWLAALDDYTDVDSASLNKLRGQRAYRGYFSDMIILKHTRSIALCYKSVDTLAVRESRADLAYYVGELRDRLKKNKDCAAENATLQHDLKQATRNYDRVQKKLNSVQSEYNSIKDELTKAKEAIKEQSEVDSLKHSVLSLQEKLNTATSQNAAYKARIKTLEERKSREEQLNNRVKNLQNRLDEAMHLNKMIMDAPEDDLVDLTAEELTILHSIKAHLIVPTMDSMRELQKLMPKSVFTFTTNDSNYRMRIQTGCDIFFFCLKFCSHGNYWQWRALLDNATNRCVALYSVNKNNIARAIIARYTALEG